MHEVTVVRMVYKGGDDPFEAYHEIISHRQDKRRLYYIHMMQHGINAIPYWCRGIGQHEDQEHNENRYVSKPQTVFLRYHHQYHRDKEGQRVIRALRLHEDYGKSDIKSREPAIVAKMQMYQEGGQQQDEGYCEHCRGQGGGGANIDAGLIVQIR